MLLIKGGRVIDPASGRDEIGHLVLEDGKVREFLAGEAPARFQGKVIPAEGKWVVPGLIDMHVHLRDPGYEWKEDIASGTRAAAAGGFTSVVCMANTNPVNDSPEVTRHIIEKARREGCANVFPVAAVTRGLEGKEMADFSELADAGAVAFSDDGKPVENSLLFRRAMEYVRPFGYRDPLPRGGFRPGRRRRRARGVDRPEARDPGDSLRGGGGRHRPGHPDRPPDGGGCTSSISAPGWGWTSSGWPRRAGLDVTGETAPAILHPDRRGARRVRHEREDESAAARRGRPDGDPRGNPGRHDRRDRLRPRPARGVRQEVRVRRRGQRHHRAADLPSAHALPAGRGKGRSGASRRSALRRARADPRPARQGNARRRRGRRRHDHRPRGGMGIRTRRTCSRSRRTAPSSGGRCAAARMRRSAEGGSATRRSRESRRMPDRKALLVLADGTVYEGTAFGYEGECSGEVVFNTGMTGYQEVLTDPSYKGQIVTMTYPEIGNTGINPEDVESNRPWIEGFVVREAWGPPSNWRHVESLDAYLRQVSRLRDRGNRHPRPHAASPGRRVPDGGPVGDRSRRRPPRAESAGAPFPRGARPGEGGHLRPCGPLDHGGLGPREGVPAGRRVPGQVRTRPADRRDRLRDQAEHPPDDGLPRVRRDRRAGRRHRGGGPGASPRTASSCRTGRATPKACRTPSRRSARCSGKSRCSASASGTRSWGSRWGERRSS